MKIRKWLLLHTLVPLTTVLLGAGLLGHLYAQSFFEEKAVDILKATTETLRRDVEDRLDDAGRDLRMLITNRMIMDYFTHQDLGLVDKAEDIRWKVETDFLHAARAQPEYHSIQLADLDGRLAVAILSGKVSYKRPDLSEEGWVRHGQALKKDDVHVSHVYYSSNDRPEIIVTKAYHDDLGAQRGVASISLRPDLFFRKVLDRTIGESGYAYLVDDSGRVVAHADPAQIGMPAASFPATRNLVEGKSGVVSEPDMKDGPSVMKAYQPIGKGGLGLMVVQPLSEITAFGKPQRIFNTALGIVALLVVSFLIYLAARQISGPLEHLTRTAEKIGEGDLAVELDEEVESAHTEVRSLGTTISGMASSLARREEELERSNAELQQFAYAISHDLQEPLRTISSYLELIKRRYGETLDDDGLEFLEFGVTGSKNMQRMIRGLLEYSRVQTDGIELQPTDSSESLKAALGNLRGAIEETGGEVTVTDMPVVMADSGQLGRLFQNLIGNAIKYRDPERPPRVAVRAERTGKEWTFAVEDNGIGIDPKYADRIFIVFRRLHGRGTYEGTGVGLAICKRIVEHHGGRIWVESTPGEGSRFFFTLPAPQ